MQSPCHHPALYMAGTRFFQGLGEFVQAGAAGHYVIYNGDTFASQICMHGKCAFDVFDALLQRQAGLWRREFLPDGAMRIQFSFIQMSGDFQRLVEAAFLHALGMHGHGDNHVYSAVCRFFCQQLAKSMAQREHLAIFEALQHGICRVGVGEYGLRGIVMRRIAQAGAAG